ncbi:hypothetical protein [Pyxidicoccus trucidator]|uniref:hypothetical protein n=1 Tax=Pyxidicoccus trucidator TaxID=2709662 RepID=UPI0013D96B7A|nr:hypothetical protein [Pyxidicoccus trucidator]
MNTTTTRKSPMVKSQHPNNNLWHGSFAFPCIRPVAAHSFPVGLRSYRGYSPDSC